MASRPKRSREPAACLALALFTLPAVCSAYYLQLSELQTSVGTWDSVFRPGDNEYLVSVDPATSAIVVQCKVNFSQYSDPAEYPVVEMNGTVAEYGFDQPIMHAFDLGTSPFGCRRTFTIVVARPGSSTEFASYLLHIEREPDLETLLHLQRIALYDDRGQPLDLDPPFSNDSALGSVHEVLVEPQVERVNVSAACHDGIDTQIQGEHVDAGKWVWVPVIKSTTDTLVQVACSLNGHRRTLTVHVHQHIDLEALDLTFLVLGGPGSVRWQDLGDGTFGYLALTSASVIELVPEYHDERVFLTLTMPDGIVAPLTIGLFSPPLDVPKTGNVTLPLTMRAGAAVREEVIVLRSQPAPPPTPPPASYTLAASVGQAMAAGAAVFVALPATIAGTAAVLGFSVGGPRVMPAAAAARSLALLLQFAAVLGGAALQEDSAFTFFARKLNWLVFMRNPPALANGGDSLDGQDLALEEAACCMRTMGLCASAVMVLHALALAQRLWTSCSHTLPHCMTLGAWEVRCLPHLMFPASCVSTLILLQGQRALHAVAVLVAVPLIIAGMGFRVYRAQHLRQIVWVTQRDAHVAVNAGAGGYFCDRVCDQLTSRPTDFAYSRLPSMNWVTTVAGIREVSLPAQPAQDGFAKARDRLLQPLTRPDGQSDGSDEEAEEAYADDEDSPGGTAKAARDYIREVPVSEHPWMEVEVTSTVSPGALLGTGREALVGFCTNVPWLDAFLSVEGLTRLHQEVEDHFLATPVRVRIGQLQGPVTSGRLGACFEGVRLPLLFPGELLVRSLLGLLMALVLASPAAQLPALACVGFVEAWVFTFAFLWMPCTSFVDNTFLMLSHLAIGTLALVYLAHLMGIFGADIASFLALLGVGLVAGGALLVASAVILSLIVAISCPPPGVDEEEDDYQSCNIDLALTGPDGKWFLLLPASCKLAVTDAFIHTVLFGDNGAEAEVYVTANQVQGRSRLEFPVLDFLGTSHQLEPPLAILLGPPPGHTAFAKEYGQDAPVSTGHRAEWIYPEDDVRGIATQFAIGSDATCEFEREVTQQVVELVRGRAGPGKILVMVVLPAPRKTHRARKLTQGLDPSLGEDPESGEELEELQALVPSLRSHEATDVDG